MGLILFILLVFACFGGLVGAAPSASSVGCGGFALGPIFGRGPLVGLILLILLVFRWFWGLVGLILVIFLPKSPLVSAIWGPFP